MVRELEEGRGYGVDKFDRNVSETDLALRTHPRGVPIEILRRFEMADSSPDSKEEIRKAVWNEMEGRGVARFPRPVQGRIPNFKGAGRAAENLAELGIFKRSGCVKVNPDSPQHPVRRRVIEAGKTLYMPTPRLKDGFLRIDPKDVPSGEERRATTIKHSFRYGRKVDVDDIEDIDLVVAGSVAVARDGARVGKGGGYSDLEYAILRELGLGEPPVATTVHPIQIREELPVERHDVPLDWIVTPQEVIETNTRMEKPDGIDWSILDDEDMDKIPLLKRFKDGRRSLGRN